MQISDLFSSTLSTCPSDINFVAIFSFVAFILLRFTMYAYPSCTTFVVKEEETPLLVLDKWVVLSSLSLLSPKFMPCWFALCVLLQGF